MPTGIYIRKPISAERLEQIKKCSPFQNGHKGFGGGSKLGSHASQETRQKMSEVHKERYKAHPEQFCGIGSFWNGRKRPEFTQEHRSNMSTSMIGRIAPSGEKHYKFKHGISGTSKYFREWRLKTGRTKENKKGKGVSKKIHGQRRRSLIKGGGPLTLKMIQMVYEDNIKKFGTLTCYLCLQQIQIGKDTLEHKTPLSRGGNNNYENLGIACSHCNCRKHIKTEQEYRKGKIPCNS